MDDEKLNKRWAKYFEDILNVDDKRKVIVVRIRNERRMPVCKRCNNEIEYDEVCGVVKKLKVGKSPGIDEIVVEYLKEGRMYVTE